jgi:hypothetical protein
MEKRVGMCWRGESAHGGTYSRLLNALDAETAAKAIGAGGVACWSVDSEGPFNVR